MINSNTNNNSNNNSHLLSNIINGGVIGLIIIILCWWAPVYCTSPTASIVRLTSARDGVCIPACQRRCCSSDSSQHDWGSRFPRHRCPRVEQFTVVCHVIDVTVDFQATLFATSLALALLFLSLSTEHVVVFSVCYVSLQFFWLNATLIFSLIITIIIIIIIIIVNVCVMPYINTTSREQLQE